MHRPLFTVQVKEVEWDPDKHPRAANGQFGDGDGGTGSAGATGQQIPTWDQLTAMKNVDGPKGSQGGQWKQDKTGQQYLVKPAKSDAHAYNEVAAGAVYHAAGIPFPNTAVIHDPQGKPFVVSQKVDGLHALSKGEWAAHPEIQAQAAKDFGVDALLSHWDVGGLVADNTLVDKNGTPVRIEAGGAMAYRGEGEPKPSFAVGQPWQEPQSMRTSDQGKVLYGKMTDKQVADSLNKAAQLDLGKVADEWHKIGVPNSRVAVWYSVLKARQEQIPSLVQYLNAGPQGTTSTAPVSTGDRTQEYLGRDLHAEGVWGPITGKERYGTVMFNDQGQILLREPTNHFDNTNWTFSKGGPDGGEHPVQTALRESAEETGKIPSIVGHIPGGFGGSSTGSKNYYYLAKDSGNSSFAGQAATAMFLKNGETASLKWAHPLEAMKLINQSTNVKARDRDIQTLKAAVSAIAAARKSGGTQTKTRKLQPVKMFRFNTETKEEVRQPPSASSATTWLANMVHDKAKQAEPDITKDVKEAVRGTADLSGLSQKLKTPNSIARKVTVDAKEKGVPHHAAAAQLSDTVRYTAVIPHQKYVHGTNHVLDKLRVAGHTVRKVKNGWKPDSPYKGVNAQLTAPSGHKYELQFHTPESQRAQQDGLPAYEGHRDLPDGHPQKQRYQDELIDHASNVLTPKGVEHILATAGRKSIFTWQTKDWSEDDHPRDDHGRFGDGSSSKPAGKETGDGKPGRHGMGDIPLTPETLANLKQSTAGPHITPDGHLTPERQALHDQIVSKALANATPVPNPRLILMGGGPASGKSVMLSSGALNIPDNAVKIDSDAIKLQIPEVDQMRQAGDDRWAALSHEESSYLAARVGAAAYETKRNAILDSTGNSSTAKLGGKIDAAHAAGFKVEGNYITVHPDSAVARANERAAKTGRAVPEDYIRAQHASISRVLPASIDKFDAVHLFDNNGSKGEPPTLIASSKGPGTLQVHDQDKYDKFLSYGKS